MSSELSLMIHLKFYKYSINISFVYFKTLESLHVAHGSFLPNMPLTGIFREMNINKFNFGTSQLHFTNTFIIRIKVAFNKKFGIFDVVLMGTFPLKR